MSIEPLPQYSLRDLYRDISNKVYDTFPYDANTFKVTVGLKWTVTHVETGYKATYEGFVSCMTDLHGLAASLLYYKKDITFNKKGELVE